MLKFYRQNDILSGKSRLDYKRIKIDNCLNWMVGTSGSLPLSLHLNLFENVHIECFLDVSVLP